jgi:hypothetical protein
VSWDELLDYSGPERGAVEQLVAKAVDELRAQIDVLIRDMADRAKKAA